MKYILYVLISLGIPSFLIAGNLLVNPGAESGDKTGWTASPSNMISVTTLVEEATGDVEPYAGEYFFRFNQGGFGLMYQDIDLSTVNDAYLATGGRIQNEDWHGGIDTGELVLTFKDISNTMVAQYSTGEIAYAFRGDVAFGAEGYGEFGIVVPIPDGAVTLRYQINGYLHGGSYVNTFMDDLYVVPLSILADTDNSSLVNLVDFAVFTSSWQTHVGQMSWNPHCDIAQPPDGTVDFDDLLVLMQFWLSE